MAEMGKWALWEHFLQVAVAVVPQEIMEMAIMEETEYQVVLGLLGLLVMEMKLLEMEEKDYIQLFEKSGMVLVSLAQTMAVEVEVPLTPGYGQQKLGVKAAMVISVYLMRKLCKFLTF